MISRIPMIVAGFLAILGSAYYNAPADTHIESVGVEYMAIDTSEWQIAGEIVVDLTDNASDQLLEEVGRITNAHFEWSSADARDDALAVGYVDNIAETMSLLSGISFVEGSEPRTQYYITGEALRFPAVPNDELFEKQWHMLMAQAPHAWTTSKAGEGIIVAVIDTGVRQVEDLESSRLLPAKSFVPRQSTDGHGHGTHVAGTIAQTTNNKIGVTGMAPAAKIMPVKVLSDQGSGQVDWIADGIDYATDNGAHIINMSLGGGYSDVIAKAVTRARAKGVLVVSACGNASRAKCDFPGGLKDNIGVSALGPTGELSFYSSYGEGVDIAAPGGDTKVSPEGGVWQNTISNGKEGYYGFQGTSMATPHVAGAAAVLMSEGLTANETEQLLYASADGEDWTPEFGNGKMNLKTALNSMGVGAGTHNSFLALTGTTFYALLVSLWVVFAGRNSGNFSRRVVVTGVVGTVGAAPLVYVASLVTTLPSWPVIEYIAMPPLVALYSLLLASAYFPTVFTWVWFSAALPVCLGWLFGASRTTRAFATGLLIAYASMLSSMVAFDPGVLTMGLAFKAWLLVNASIAGFSAVALSAVEKLESKKDK